MIGLDGSSDALMPFPPVISHVASSVMIIYMYHPDETSMSGYKTVQSKTNYMYIHGLYWFENGVDS